METLLYIIIGLQVANFLWMYFLAARLASGLHDEGRATRAGLGELERRLFQVEQNACRARCPRPQSWED